MKADAFVSSARQLSLVLVVLLAVMFEISTSYFSRANQLRHARELFAIFLAADQITNVAPQIAQLDAIHSYDEPVVFSMTLDRDFSFLIEIYVLGTPPSMNLIGLRVNVSGKRDWGSDFITFYEDYHGNWVESAQSRLLDLGDRESIEFALEEASFILDDFKVLTRLTDIAFDLEIETSGITKVREIYERIEREIVLDEVTVPNIQSARMAAPSAMWFLSAFTFSLLIVVSNRVRAIFQDQELACNIPWLVLDGRVGIERVFAILWLGMILLSPWIYSAMLFGTMTSQISTQGVQPHAIVTAIRVSGLLTFMLVGAWVSASIVSMCLELRRRRGVSLGVLQDIHRESE